MKTRFMHIATNVCSLTLALMPYFYYKGSSIIFSANQSIHAQKKAVQNKNKFAFRCTPSQKGPPGPLSFKINANHKIIVCFIHDVANLNPSMKFIYNFLYIGQAYPTSVSFS